MKNSILLVLAMTLFTFDHPLFAQGTAFTYQGRLQTSGSPANGNYDFRLALFNTNNASNGQVGGTLTNLDVGVTNGLFALTLDFGASFAGNATWLAIGVRTNGGSQFTALTPLPELTPTPYAIFAGAVNAAGLSGTIAAANIANGTITSNLLAAGAVGSNQLASSIGLWLQSGNNLSYDLGNVGIGTTTPAAPLHVNSSGVPSALVDGSSISGTWEVLRNTSAGGTNWQFISAGSGAGVGAGNLLFNCGFAPAFPTLNVLTLRPNGNVGIGTALPANNLEVAGTAQFDSYVGIGTETPTAPLQVVGDNDFPHLIVAASSNAPYGAFLSIDATATAGGKNYLIYSTGGTAGEGQGKLAFQDFTDGKIAMCLTSNGNIGMGTTTPANNLEVAGTAQIDGYLGIGTATPANQLEVAGTAQIDGYLGIGTATPANRLEVAGTAQFDGYVGIGTETPTAPLHVESRGFPCALMDGSSIYGTWNVLRNTSAGGTNWQFIATGSGNGEGAGKLLFNCGDAPTDPTINVLTLQPNGNVGIGTTSPGKAALEVDGAVNTSGLTGQDLTAAGGVRQFAGQSISLSIYAAGGVASAGFYAFSDERLKRVHGRSDAARDLATLLGIEVTDYSFIDTAARGPGTQKKVIAQQVEKVYPQAVRQSTDVVPDIYQQATVEDGWVRLATRLKVGERVKLVSGREQGVYEVTAVRDGAFRTTFNPPSETVFVYGREVNDFRTVDYDALAMLNVSATQELARKLEAQRAELARLQSQLAQALTEKDLLMRHLADLEARDQALDARLARIEMSPGRNPAPLASTR